MLRHSRLLPLAAAFVAASAAAQPPSISAPGAGQGTAAPSLSYRSPLAGYQAFTEESVISWKQANDTVGRIGGWREYARESAPPAAASHAPATASPPGAAPAQAAPDKPTAAPAAPATPAAPAASAAPGAGHGGHQH